MEWNTEAVKFDATAGMTASDPWISIDPTLTVNRSPGNDTRDIGNRYQGCLIELFEIGGTFHGLRFLRTLHCIRLI